MNHPLKQKKKKNPEKLNKQIKIGFQYYLSSIPRIIQSHKFFAILLLTLLNLILDFNLTLPSKNVNL